jgi:hypothetical protein
MKIQGVIRNTVRFLLSRVSKLKWVLAICEVLRMTSLTRRTRTPLLGRIQDI